MFQFTGEYTSAALVQFLSSERWYGDAAVPVTTTLSDSTFDSVTQSNTALPWLLMFYKPSSPRYNDFKQTWIAWNLNLTNTIQLAQVNCDDNIRLCSRFDVKEYPTIMLLRDNKTYFYHGENRVEDVKIFALEKYATVNETKEIPTYPSLKLTEMTFDSVIKKYSNQTWLVLFYAPWFEPFQQFKPVWDNLAANLSKYQQFAEVDCQENTNLCEQLLLEGQLNVLLLDGEKMYSYAGNKTFDDLRGFTLEGYKTQTARAYPKLEVKSSPQSSNSSKNSNSTQSPPNTNNSNNETNDAKNSKNDEVVEASVETPLDDSIKTITENSVYVGVAVVGIVVLCGFSHMCCRMLTAKNKRRATEKQYDRIVFQDKQDDGLELHDTSHDNDGLEMHDTTHDNDGLELHDTRIKVSVAVEDSPFQ